MNSILHTPSISIVVPLYYLPELHYTIDKFFRSLDENYRDVPLIVFVDCSPSDHPFNISHKNEKNLGYVKSVNIGLKLSNTDIVIVMNDDLVIKKGDLDPFFEIGDGIYCPQDSCSSYWPHSGACFAMNRKTLKKMGYLNEEYKHFFADREYWLKADELGIPIVKLNKICIEHPGSATFNLLDKRKIYLEDEKVYIKKNPDYETREAII